MDLGRFARSSFAGLDATAAAELCHALEQLIEAETAAAADATFAAMLSDLEQDGLALGEVEREGRGALVAPLGERELQVTGLRSFDCAAAFGATGAHAHYPWPKRMSSPALLAVRAAQLVLEKARVEGAASLDAHERRIADVAGLCALVQAIGLRGYFESELADGWEALAAELARIGARRSAEILSRTGQLLGMAPVPPRADRIDILRALTSEESERLLSLDAAWFTTGESPLVLAAPPPPVRAGRKPRVRAETPWVLREWNEVRAGVRAMVNGTAVPALVAAAISEVGSARLGAVTRRRLRQVVEQLAGLGHRLVPRPHPLSIDLVDLHAPPDARLRLTLSGLQVFTVVVLQRPRRRRTTTPAPRPAHTAWTAVERHDPEQLRAAIAAGADVNRRSRGGWSLLERALWLLDAACARVLLAAGARADGTGARGRNRNRALELALLLDQPDLVAAVLANGGRAHGEAGSVPLNSARSPACAQLLLDAGASADDVDAADWNPLMGAAAAGNVVLTRFFASRVRDIDRASKHQGSALALACRRPEGAPAVPVLLAAGADPDRRGPRKETARGVACAEAARILEGWATGTGRAAIARELAPIERAEDLAIACRQGLLAQVQRLLAAGVDPRARAGGEEPPLVLAAAHGHAPVVRALLEAGALADAPGSLGRTALACAVRSGQAEIASALMDAGAALEPSDGPPVLAVAVASVQPAMVAMLAKLGVSAAALERAQDALAAVRRKEAGNRFALDAIDEIARALPDAARNQPFA